ncbi:MAG: hypothetical protein K8F24_08040, partial [Bacteroidales bacterium]|nr:hypothetical protein [Bacteroidales bacterium]
VSPAPRNPLESLNLRIFKSSNLQILKILPIFARFRKKTAESNSTKRVKFKATAGKIKKAVSLLAPNQLSPAC